MSSIREHDPEGYIGRWMDKRLTEMRQEPRQQQSMVMRGMLWLLLESHFQAVEALSSAGLLTLAVWSLIVPDAFRSLPSFTQLRVLTSDSSIYAAVAGVLFSVHVFMAITGRLRARMCVVFLIAGWWVAFATSVLLAVPRSPWPYLLYLIGTGAGWCWLRLFARSDEA